MTDPKLVELGIDEIEIGEHQTRIGLDDNKVKDYANSIARLGLLTPVTVCLKNDKYVLISGHHRIAACLRLGRKVISAIVRIVDADKIKEVAIAENLFRKDLTPIEQAAAFQDLLSSGDYDIQSIAAAANRSESWVRSQLALMAWPEDIQLAVHQGLISVAAATPLAKIEDDHLRSYYLSTAIESGASARQTAMWYQGYTLQKPPAEVIEQEPGEHIKIGPPVPMTGVCFSCKDEVLHESLGFMPLCMQCLRAIGQVNQPAPAVETPKP